MSEACPPVLVHLCLSFCDYPPVCPPVFLVHLCLSTCACPLVFVHLFLSTCACPPVLVHLCLSTCICPPVFVTCVLTPVLLSAPRSGPCELCCTVAMWDSCSKPVNRLRLKRMDSEDRAVNLLCLVLKFTKLRKLWCICKDIVLSTQCFLQNS